MIYLVTGTPGAGKTSNTLWDFLKNPEFAERQKYATFIPDFDYDGQNVEQLEQSELEQWRTLPSGSLVLIDEADRYLPAGNGKNPQEWVREFARHRHYGIDFVIITQMASMINDFLHGLIEAHVHYHRVRGNDYTTRYRWEFLQKNPYTKTNKALGLPQKIKDNPEVFKLYRSTTMNTRRKEFPWHAVIKMASLCSGLLFAGIFLYWFMYARHHLDTPISQPTEHSTSITKPAEISPAHEKKLIEEPTSENMPLTAQDFVPPVPTMPWAAPAYADLAKPTDFPRIAACIDSKKTGCKCFTQQYTPIDIPKDSCLRMVKEGWFDNWATGRAQQDQVLSGKPDEVSRRNEQNSKSLTPQGV